LWILFRKQLIDCVDWSNIFGFYVAKANAFWEGDLLPGWNIFPFGNLKIMHILLMGRRMVAPKHFIYLCYILTFYKKITLKERSCCSEQNISCDRRTIG